MIYKDYSERALINPQNIGKFSSPQNAQAITSIANHFLYRL